MNQIDIKRYLGGKISKKFFIVAGGTGGHVFPAEQIAKDLLKKNLSLIWIGTSRGPEQNICNRLGIKFIHYDLVGFRGKGLIYKLYSALKLFLSGLKFFFRYRLFSSQNDQMIVFGGYTSMIALFFPFRTIYAQEQNSIPGSAIRILTKLNYIDKVFLGFNQASNYFKKTKSNFLINSGNPIRDELLDLEPKNIDQLNNLLIIGGSQGSEFLNNLVPKVLREINKDELKIRHQCGLKHKKTTEKAYLQNNVNNQFTICEFIKDMREAYEWSDIVICRGGALTLSELIAVRRSAFIIPLPNSIDNHQVLNAKFFEERGFGKVFEQDSDINNLIMSLRESILDNASIKSYYEQLNKNSFVNSSKIIIDNLNT